ncbi:MAG TPA: D-isomer specific 2-hydroxyacid dehydrogenase family protein [Streptosporangiaceae bacterium]|nr:D-isomer specific 2-hydroxyacid dehydrogenase family protein [Streptosporangiaceae bacterium]
MTSPRIAIGPEPRESVVLAVRIAGGEPAPIDADADALVWLDPRDLAGLGQALKTASAARWVQLPFAGIERVAEAGLLDSDHVWTCAKGAYAEPVAEHALMLALAGLRLLRRRITARSWGEPGGESLYDEPVTILGGGGIATSLIGLLTPMRGPITVVRRQPDPVPGAARTVQTEQRREAMAGAKVVVVALALTPATEGIVGPAELAAMRPDAWLVNVARGRHVDTDALVAALRERAIGGAALDVTDPEPLPDGHPLWDLENCIITPHTADTEEMIDRLLGQRIEANVAAFAAGRPLLGVVDPEAGY